MDQDNWIETTAWSVAWGLLRRLGDQIVILYKVGSLLLRKTASFDILMIVGSPARLLQWNISNILKRHTTTPQKGVIPERRWKLPRRQFLWKGWRVLIRSLTVSRYFKALLKDVRILTVALGNKTVAHWTYCSRTLTTSDQACFRISAFFLHWHCCRYFFNLW